MPTVREIAKLIDHSLLGPTLTDDELRRGCELALQRDVAAVCIKPYAVRMAAEILRGSSVAVCTVVGFPHGSSKLEIKTFEAETACQDGAKELDLVLNIGKVLSSHWDYVEAEVRTVKECARRNKALLKVIFENDLLPDDRTKSKLCEICTLAQADFVKTSTGFGFVRGADGRYSYRGAVDQDLKLMRALCPPEIQIKAAGGVRTLDDVLRVAALGCSRVGATATEAILDEAKRRFGG